MTFPETPLAITVEMFLGGAWTDITSDVQVRDGSEPIVITRGRSDDRGTASPATATMQLNNAAGKYSPRNPLSPYYGQLTLNTPLRVTVDGTSRRFWGETSSLPPRWDTSGNDAWVPIEAAGILRRLNQGVQPLSSSLRNYYDTQAPFLDYWPLDDLATSTTGANADGSSDPFLKSGTAQATFGGDLGPETSSGLTITDTGTGSIYGSIGSSSTDTTNTIEFAYKTNLLGTLTMTLDMYGNDKWILTCRHNSTDNDFHLEHSKIVAGLEIIADLGDTASTFALADLNLHHCRLTLTEDGSDVDYTLYVDGVSVLSGTRVGAALHGMQLVQFNFTPISDGADFVIGHVAAWNDTFPVPPIATVIEALHGWVGEAAGRRFERLCDDASIPFVSTGNLDDTLAMGQQFTDALTGQFAEIEVTEGGMIYEPRDSLSTGYRTRASLYNQASAATIDYSAGELQSDFQPVDDDRAIRNDVFAQRREGSSYQMTKTTGPLSTAAPPAGVGRYKDEVQTNVVADADLPPVAGWLLLLGTVDDARYPTLTVNRANRNVVANPTLSAALLGIDPGDRIVVTNADNANIYDDISQIVVGWTETLWQYEHSFVFQCTPAAPYEVLELGDNDAWTDPDGGSSLASGTTSTATSLSVASSGFLWTTTGGELPRTIAVGGERMSVTAISGASSPQTFTVTRSTNGVVKAHSSGALLELVPPGVAGL